VVAAASYEARKFGVFSAMPSARAVVLCPDAVWAPPRFDRYKEISSAVFEIFRAESPLVQPLSIDEAFLDVSPGRYSSEHPVSIARRIRARVAALGVTASVGVATSKTVAKIASDHDKPDGLTVVCPGEEARFLAPLPVGCMSGIGPRTAERLATLGVRTLGDLSALDEVTALQVLGSSGPELGRRARGEDERPVHERDPAKQVSNERTFAADLRTPSELEDALSQLSAKVGQRLRVKALCGRTISVKIRFSDFSTRTIRRTLSTPTDDEAEFGPVASELAKSVWTPGVGIRLLGVGVSGFDERAEQLALVDECEKELPRDRQAAQADLKNGIDAIRVRFGDSAIRSGRDLASPDRERSEGDRDPDPS
jgi:DNA polymerase-4